MPKFNLYNAKLRLGGSVLNEVPLIEVTAPEIDILRVLHGGDDAVIEIKSAGSIERSHAEERARINQKYAGGGENMENQAKKKLAMIRDLFGNDRLPLPTELDEVKAEEPEIDVEAAKPPPIKRTIAKKPDPAFAE